MSTIEMRNTTATVGPVTTLFSFTCSLCFPSLVTQWRSSMAAPCYSTEAEANTARMAHQAEHETRQTTLTGGWEPRERWGGTGPWVQVASWEAQCGFCPTWECHESRWKSCLLKLEDHLKYRHQATLDALGLAHLRERPVKPPLVIPERE